MLIEARDKVQKTEIVKLRGKRKRDGDEDLEQGFIDVLLSMAEALWIDQVNAGNHAPCKDQIFEQAYRLLKHELLLYSESKITSMGQ